jgi:hypothetical protein
MKACFIFITVCGLLADTTGFATLHYVDPNCTSPQTPFTSWSHAATNIQSAVDAAVAYDTVIVTNGVYQTGGRTFGATSNRVYVSKTLNLQSVNGPAVTVIKGYQAPVTINGSSAVRCIYLTDGSTLSGFTLTNGATFNENAGGVYSAGISTVVISNCVIAGNAARSDGGGAYQGTFYNCVFSGNTTFGGLGGGAAIYAGLNNCLLVSNTATSYGGGTYNGTMRNCTCVGNFAVLGGGGAYGGTLYNSILYYNAIGANLPSGTNGYNIGIYNCCVAATNGLGLLNAGSFTNQPFFANPAENNYRLQIGSPCINAGINTDAPAGLDPDGNNRVAGGAVDLGAFELQAQVTGTITDWLHKFGLPSDGSATYADSDGDGMNNAEEWIAGTNPTNALSVLQLTPSVSTNNPSGIIVSWQSVTNLNYYLQRSSSLAVQPAFTSIQSNLVGQAGSTSYTDTTATNGGPYFYRVGVQ